METNCVEIRENLGDYTEDRLDRKEKTAVERHLHYCEECINQWTVLRVRREEDLCEV
jgi:anti-sigma factor RsiW